MSPPIISLTTDFGTAGGYVGAMKGVILAIDPDIALVDISHDVPPQDIAHGAFVLGSAYRYFTAGTVHVAVVDPGVGTSRRPVLVVTPAGRFLAPDNGLLTYVLADHQGPGSLTGAGASGQGEFMQPVAMPVPEGCSAYVLTRSAYWRHPVSDTFHGRDVFAPVAAHLSRGVPPHRMGDPVEELVCLDLLRPETHGGMVEGQIIFVDHFGNLVSNIRSSHLSGGGVEVEVGGTVVSGLSRTYAETEGVAALVGSHGYLEVAERNGNAADRLGVGVGGRVRVVAAT
jgi:S-adenosylmethionine hydrolase